MAILQSDGGLIQAVALAISLAALVDEALNPEVRGRANRALGLTKAGGVGGVLRGLTENADLAIATEAGFALERIRTRDFS